MKFASFGKVPLQIKDKAALWGLLASFGLISLAIILGGNSAGFFDLRSLILVVGGTLGATLVTYSVADLKQMLRDVFRVVSTEPRDVQQRMRYMVRLSQVVRSEGNLIMEREAAKQDDPFLRMALEVTVDGQHNSAIERILTTEMQSSSEKSGRAVQVLETMGNYSPALGLIGTLVGLIQMLGSLQDPTAVAPAMSLALVTTLYGAILANLVFIPLSGKLRNRLVEENLIKTITMEALLGIAKLENPIVIEQRLQSFLPRCA